MADPTKAWDRAFTSGSKVMQDRLKSVHAKNPAFQSWLKSSGHGAGESVKQASKEIKQTVRAKQLAAKSATAYGATKGLAVGGEHGGAGVAQKADKGRVWSPDEVAALNKQRGTEPVQLTPAQKRMAAIKAAAEKSVAKKAKSFDVPTLQRQHDDLRDVHDSLHSKVTRSSMDEEVELDEMDKSQPSSSRGAEGLALGKKADPVKTDKVKSDALKLLQKQYKKVKEEVEQIDEIKIPVHLAMAAAKAVNSAIDDKVVAGIENSNARKLRPAAGEANITGRRKIIRNLQKRLHNLKRLPTYTNKEHPRHPETKQKVADTDAKIVQARSELEPHLKQQKQTTDKYNNAVDSDVRTYRNYGLVGLGLKRLKQKIVGEEVEHIDEANMRFDYEAAARPKSSDVKNFLNRDKNPRAAAASKKYIRRMTKLGGLGPNQTKKDTEAHMKAHFEEVELEEGKYASTIAAIAAQAYEPKVGDEVRTRKGGQIPGKVEKIEGNKVFFRHPEGKLYATHSSNLMKEEVELEEGKIAKALAVGAMSLASMGAKAHTDTTKSVAQLAAERPALAQRLKDIGATGQVPASDKRAAELQRKQDQEMPASERRAKELKKEEVEQIDEGKGYSPGWMLKKDPKLGKKLKDKINLAKKRQASYGNPKAGISVKEEVEQVDEVTKQEAEAALGGPVKEKPTMPPGKQPAGHRYVRNLARRAMKAGLKKEEVEQIDEQSPAEIKAKYYHDQFDKVKPVKAYDKEGKLVGHYRSMDHAKQMKPGHTYKVEEEVVTEAEREAGYKMPPAVRAAQKKSDALSKVKKPAQAGTLAATYKSGERAVRRAMEREMSRNMGEEAVEREAEYKASPKKKSNPEKKEKAVLTAVSSAKKFVHKINVKPELKSDTNTNSGK